VLGAGTGIVSLVLAALRSGNLGSSHDEPGSILSTDLRKLCFLDLPETRPLSDLRN